MKLGHKLLLAPVVTAVVVLAAGQIDSWLLSRSNAQAVAAMTPDERVLLERLQGIHKANAEETLRSLFGAPVFEDESGKSWSMVPTDRSSTLTLVERWGSLTLIWQAEGKFVYLLRL